MQTLTVGRIVHVYSRFDPEVPSAGIALSVSRGAACIRKLSPYAQTPSDMHLSDKPGREHAVGTWWWEWPPSV